MTINLFKKAQSPDGTPGSVMHPIPKPSRWWQAIDFYGRRIDNAVGNINYRRLERNKYAPWGRGDCSGLPNNGEMIQSFNR